MNHDRLPQDPMTDSDQREWLAQERAMRDERNGATPNEDPLLAAYRDVARALRAPLPDALPADFARMVAAQCRPAAAPVRADTRFEQQFQRVLLGLLATAAIAACAVYGGDWLRATSLALPVLNSGVALNWAAALAACLGLSWSMDLIRRRARAV